MSETGEKYRDLCKRLTYSSVGAMPSGYLIVLERPLKVSTDLSDSIPKRSSFNISTKAVNTANSDEILA